MSAQPQELGCREARERPVPRQLDQALEPDARLDLRALGRRALVVPEDRRSEDVASLVQADEPVHLAREPHSALLGPEAPERRLARPPPILGILLRPAGLRRRQPVVLLRGCDDLSVGGDGECLDAGRADVEADQGRHSAPRAAYTSSYARTASLRCCASRSAASSIFAATESMKRHCRTLRFTASTASSVYGYRSNPRRSPFSP